MNQTLKSVLFIFLLSSCSTLPSGPSVLVLPGTGKDFARFQDDDRQCKQYASQIIATAQNTSDAEQSQQYYDNSYIQCMYAKDHLVPIAGELRYDSQDEEDAGSLPPPPPDMPPPR